jgi:[methyl-Co(III) methanol-specific corrinoid protein]:coenzyme M methyltransferase
MMANSRTDILSLLSGQKINRIPVFSGLINITKPGLESVGVKLHEIHHDAGKMAQAALSSYRLFGLESAVLPLELTVEAEMLGAGIDFRESSDKFEFPRVAKIPNNESNFRVEGAGRIPVICDAIRTVKAEAGNEIPIGAYIPGPFTLLFMVSEGDKLFLELKKSPETVHERLTMLADVLAQSAQAYRAAGADFMTVHEMGGSPGVLGAKRFEAFVLPALRRLMGQIAAPRILSVCGNTNAAMPLLASAGADALSVDQTNDLSASRAALPGALLFGNIDPVSTLAYGTPDDVRAAVRAAVAAGADAVMPGCDLYPPTPLENLRALTEN